MVLSLDRVLPSAQKASKAARKTTSNETSLPTTTNTAVHENSYKAACSCGSGCPKCESSNRFEKEADKVASGISRDEKLMPTTPAAQKNNSVRPELSGEGQSLSVQARNFYEPRLGANFDQVRIHDNPEAAASAQSLEARAYTRGNHIVFNEGEYSPHTNAGKELLAHELTHVVQQRQHNNLGIQRQVQLRPPGRGEASAFDRANELVDRLNELSLGVTYFLGGDGRTLNYRILLPTEVDNFDQQMMDFIDLPQVIPLRLITSAGLARGVPVVGDTFHHGYVDLDDLMASDDLGFQSIMLHFIEERAVTPRYEQRIGSPSLDERTPAGGRAFNRGHTAGHNAQAEHFRDVFNDPSIVFSRGRRRNNAGDADIIFRSQTHGYRIMLGIDRALFSTTGRRPRNVTGGTVRVVHNEQTFTVDDFLTTGPLAAVLRPIRFPLNPGRFGLGVPRLQLDPTLRFGSPSLLPNLNTPLAPTPTLLPSVPLSTSPDLSQINWLSIRGELNLRGAPISDTMLDSITSLWVTNYNFLNQVVGFSPARAAFWTNKTIPLAVGNSISHDYPTMTEQIDRELGTSTTTIPASDILFFLLGGGGSF